ncbi:Mce family protein [Gordonia hirsuta DSM 44140 = NBRC 16056]|uniref:Mce family protein n=1 Tax=Gordonia hirsuta DSM 44140 = NBRC 16056 TaxID=1121927 RepID=L7LDL3_9ACTN|nr:MlaD family protein [Gordonia hirsuta]GAC58133.1 Mce family protein [Gordonia hirsuta DSM 44140 = NBRC 16056]
MPLWVDPSGREPKTVALRLIGAAVTVVLVISGLFLAKWSNGDYADRFRLTLVTDRIGDGLAVGADVKFRGHRIGEVESISVDPDGQQRVLLSVLPAQSAGLTADVIPAYMAPNMFAGTGVELVSTGRDDAPLRNGQTLNVPSGGTSLGTLTSVLGRVGKLTATLGDPSVYTALDSLLDHSEPAIGLVKEAMPLFAGLADDQEMTVGDMLSDLNTLLGVVTPVVPPALALVDESLDATAYLDEPDGLPDVRAGIDGLSKRLVVPLGRILGENLEPIDALIQVALDFAVPIVVSVGTVPQAYSKLTRLVRNTGDAFVETDDGKVRLLVDVLLTKTPQIAAPLLSKDTGRGDR